MVSGPRDHFPLFLFLLLFLPHSRPGLPFSPSFPPLLPSLAVAASFGISAVKLGRARPVLVTRMSASAVDDAGTPGEVGSACETNSDVSPQPTGGSTGLPLPDVSVWAKWVLGPVLLFAIPLYKKILRTEEVVEKSVEAASEEAERVAEVVKKVAADVAIDLPVGGGLRKVVLRIEEVADMVIVYAEEAETFIHKVDEIKEVVEEAMEPIIKEAESILNEGEVE